jgi:hypothetical protein
MPHGGGPPWRVIDPGTRMALLATSDGQRVYERCKFVEVARFGYWYRSFRSSS